MIEEAPEGARAYAASMLALAGGFGFSLAVVALPFADIGDAGWRLAVRRSARSRSCSCGRSRAACGRPPATQAIAGTDRDRARAASASIVDPRYGRRFVLLGRSAFLPNIFNAPSSQLMNKYLEDVRDFSNTGIALFRTVTTGAPGPDRAGRSAAGSPRARAPAGRDRSRSRSRPRRRWSSSSRAAPCSG